MNISVFGLGYVGAVTAGCLCQRGHRVIGVDKQETKVEMCNRGEPPIVEPGLNELFIAGRAAGLLSATTDAEDAVLKTDASVICVGTPSSSTGELDLSFVRGVAKQIADVLSTHQKRHTVLIRSTMMPGSTSLIVEKFFAELERGGLVSIICYPEFLREGTAVADFDRPPLVVVGTRNGQPPPESIQALIGHGAHILEFRAAEVVKHACNAFHATKVTFANEIGRWLKSLEIDAQTVMAILCQDTKLNLSPYYMKPGNAFGGSCLPKDVRAVCRQAHTRGLELPLLNSLLASNSIHLQELIRKIERMEKEQVVLLGLSFKPNTDDLRESPMVEVAEHLWRKGVQLRIYEPALKVASLVGSNKQAGERKMPHLAALLRPDLQSALGDGGLIVAAHRCLSIQEIRPFITSSHRILDVNGWPELRALPVPYEGFCW
jgi:GDP-mannose 6-dehydrogenase